MAESESSKVGIGVIGLGYWGPNLVRNFNANPDAQVVALCDMDDSRLDLQILSHPMARGNQFQQHGEGQALERGFEDAVPP